MRHDSKFAADTKERILRKSEATCHHPYYLVLKMKLSASLMGLGCMSGPGVENLIFIDGIMKSQKYIHNLKG